MSDLHTEFSVSFGRDPIGPPVESVSGLGAVERWGRWNNDNHIAIRFERDLPPAFEARFHCSVASANIGRAITVMAGGCSRKLVCVRTLRQGVAVASIPFRLDRPARTMEILVPDLEPGSVLDLRPLGFALSSLSIIPAQASGRVGDGAAARV